MGDQRCVSLDFSRAVYGSNGTNSLHERDLVHSQIRGLVLYLSSFAVIILVNNNFSCSLSDKKS